MGKLGSEDAKMKRHLGMDRLVVVGRDTSRALSLALPRQLFLDGKIMFKLSCA